MIEGLAACFVGLDDPRASSRCDHQLIDILVIAVCAVIACAESWEDIELYGRSKQAWLKTFLALRAGDHRADRDHEDVDQLMIAPARRARIIEPDKARRQAFDHAARPRLPRSENRRHDLRSATHPAHA